MSRFKLTYFIAFCLYFLLFSCNLTKHVPEGKYLVNKNEITFLDEKLDAEGVNLIIRQQTNKKAFGIRLKLYLYNSIDSTKVAASQLKRYNKLQVKNKKRRDRINRINDKRIAKARKKNSEYYIEKVLTKDTINPKSSLREWLKYKKGEAPVIYDSALHRKTVDQMKIYLTNKGYYYGTVTSRYEDNVRNPKKRNVFYEIASGKPYIIDSILVECANPQVLGQYNKFAKDNNYPQLKGERLDSDVLDEYRNHIAKYMKDHSIFAFSPSSIVFVADSSKSEFKSNLKIIFSDRQIAGKDTVYTVPYRTMHVGEVHFHILDTIYYKGNYKKRILEKKLDIPESNDVILALDTIYYRQILYTSKEKKQRNIPKSVDSLNPWRFAHVYYNLKPTVRPEILELQNYLESQNAYKEYYIDRSYNRMMQLDVFQAIKLDVKENERRDSVTVNYYLIPAAKQSFNFEPRFTNSNGFLGLAASVNYNNKNIFRGSEKLTISVSGGFESQPPVFDKNLDGTPIKKAGRSFNTFEIGPSVKFDIPGLFPMKATSLSKRHRPRTVLSTAYNYQKRDDFVRSVFQLNYLWKFYPDKKQVFQIGFPAGAIKFVSIDKDSVFEARLNSSNDLFLKNSYSNQFIWEDFKFLYEYNNKADKKGKANILFNASINNAGWLLSLLSVKNVNDLGQHTAFGVGFSRFLRFDTDFIYGYPLGKKMSVHARSAMGLGIPMGNNTISLPYDYSFFAGGSNDNRGWRARALGPGSYKYYLDTGRTATQIGDIRLGGFAELRYSLSATFKTAIFLDAGNIWTYNNDEKRDGGQFSGKFYKEIALSTGIGLRMDLSFFIIRLDLGIPLTNPALPIGSRWIFQSRQAYHDEGLQKFGIEYKKLMPKPFIPVLAFGIGYPF